MLITTVAFVETSAKILYLSKLLLILLLRLVYKSVLKLISPKIQPTHVNKTVLIRLLPIISANIVWHNALTLLRVMEILY